MTQRHAPDPTEVFREWEQGADGVWTREAARAVVVDPAHRVLLLRGADVANPGVSWWFTPGGGVAPGESQRAAAARELFEETGLRVSGAALVGPIAHRVATFPYFGRPCRQTEVLFLALMDDEVTVHTNGWTEVERASVIELRWWPVAELTDTAETVYPAALGALVGSVLTEGWDGRSCAID